MSDLTLRRNILDELEFQPHIRAATIGVAVENGIVSLTGHVRTYAEKIAAERAVKNIKGVRAVAEEIEVWIPSDIDLTDEIIASRCLDVIHWDGTIPEERIHIKVQQGRVTLEGEVDWQYQKEAVQGAVRTLVGVVGVDNLIMLKPKAPPDDIKLLIESALARNALLESSHIRVSVAEKTVTLEGRVHMWSQRKAAEHSAWAVPGVLHVDNQLLMA